MTMKKPISSRRAIEHGKRIATGSLKLQNSFEYVYCLSNWAYAQELLVRL